jgi:malonyl-CoA O-methyltransferase
MGSVGVTVQEGYSLWADVYDHQGNPLIELEECLVEPLLAKIEGRRVLDAGAGTGRYALKLARRGSRVTAIDPNPEMLGVAKRAAGREHLDIEFIQAGNEHGLPVEAGLYDLAVCALVLCHVPGLADVAREFHRALRPGGLLLITDFHPDTLAKGVETQLERDGVTYRLPNEPHTRDTYLDAVEGAGFELVEMLELPTRKADRERFSDEYWLELADTNFCMIILAQKRS